MEENLKYSWNTSQYLNTSALQATVADELIKNLQIKPEEDVLDVGCGIGNITMNIASIACRGRVLGIDDSSAMIDQANENLLSGSLNNVSFELIRATELNFNRQFDVVFSNSVFHWIKDQDMVLQSVKSCLKPGGRIGLQFPVLDKSHPMIHLVNEAIHHLDLAHYYDNRVFPWFVPESGYKYAELLNRFKYKNVTVKEVETYYTFDNTLAVINFFNAVGLDLYLEPLSREERILLEMELSSLVEQKNNFNGIRLGFHRLYAYANL